MNTKTISCFIERYWILIVLIAIKVVLQFVFKNPVYELHRDEFLYLDQAHHPSAGYISVPPFTSWIASIIFLLGGGVFWIKFFPAFFGALTIVFAWLIVEETGGGLSAKIFVSISLILSVLVRINLLFQPNSFDILVWTAIFYFFIIYIKTQHTNWLMLLSLIIAIGVYNKYTIIFLIAGLFAGVLLTPLRKLFSKKIFYVSIAFCLILLMPNIIWQIKNNFPVIHHMQALHDRQLVNNNRADFLLDQVKYGLIGILTLAALVALLFYKQFKAYRFIGWTFVVSIILFTIGRAKNYYAIGLYPVLFALGSVYLEAIFKKWKVVLFSLLGVLNVVLFFMIVKYLMPLQNPSEMALSLQKIGLPHWEDGKEHALPQDFADMLGWREMSDKALIAYKMIPADELDRTLIFCDNYGEAGALNYYNRGKMPKAYSFNTDYIYWLPEKNEIKNLVFVGNAPGKEIIDMFKEYKLVDTVGNKFAREMGTKIFLLRGSNATFTERFYRKAEKLKKDFDIF
jgi:hypothetical protein